MRLRNYFVISLLILILAAPSFGSQQRAKLPQSAYLKSAKISMLGNPPRYEEALQFLDTMLFYYGPIPEGFLFRGNIYAEYANKESDLSKKLGFFEKMAENYDSMASACGNKEIKSGLRNDCKKFSGVTDSIRTFYWRETYNSGVQAIDTVNEFAKKISGAADSAEILTLKEQMKMTADSGRLFFQIAATVDPSRYRSFEGIGLLYDRLKQYDSSLVWLKKASAIVPDTAYLIQNIAYSYIQMDDWDNAIAYFKKYLEKVPNDANTCFNIAICYSNKRQYDSAYVWDLKTIAADTTISGAYTDAGQYFLVRSQAVYDSVRNTTDKAKAEQFGKLRDTYLDSSAYYLKTAHRLEPDNGQILEQLAVVLFARANFTDALEAFKKLTELEPNRKEYWISVGDIYIQLQKFKEAIPPYEKATELDPGDIKLWEVLKDLYTNNNMPDKAKAAEAKIADLQKM
ncbi:hypothetical protein TRIP_C60417 [Candidatus Zixiibacteriota bacterium]|nr:hypothetical protein TRIP_C60417 [candidate division Zixibacteria bacterium]